MTHIRPPAVAGQFYPADPAMLAAEVDRLLAEVPLYDLPPARAYVVPHAGYVYSGRTAAQAYVQLRAQHQQQPIARIVLLGPTHRIGIRGLGYPTVTHFATPLGDVAIDQGAITSLADLPWVQPHDATHAQEHSLEVQLPFLQRILPDCQLVPLAVGQASPTEVASVLARLERADTVILISSDLSHYLDHAQASQQDGQTCALLDTCQAVIRPEQACGAHALNGLLLHARTQDWTPLLLDLRNSGDTAGSRDRVVGYASYAWITADRVDAELRTGLTLLQLARRAIEQQWGGPAPTLRQDSPLLAPGASFVTLSQHGQLRGCIGSLEARRPLAEDVVHNALAAAFRDPRFPPLQAAERWQTRVEVSQLTPAEAFPVSSEQDALSRLRPGVDGLIFTAGTHQATFLPQVWETLPDPATFMAQLKRKAGLPADYWSDSVRLARYQVRKWRERWPE